MRIQPLLTPQQATLLETVRKPFPVPMQRLVFALYGDRPDGGPDDPARSISVQLCKLRQRLDPYGIIILTVGIDGYMVDPRCSDRLATLLASWLPAALAETQSEAAVTSH